MKLPSTETGKHFLARALVLVNIIVKSSGPHTWALRPLETVTASVDDAREFLDKTPPEKKPSY